MFKTDTTGHRVKGGPISRDSLLPTLKLKCIKKSQIFSIFYSTKNFKNTAISHKKF